MSDKRKILVVDDDVPLATLITEILDTMGYEATTFNNSMDALRHYQESGDSFDMVITDQTMPGLTGVELAKAILEQSPNMPIMLCTGFSEQVDAERAKSLGIQGFLQKPMDIRAMTDEVNRLLGE
ncbi:MAG: response regulator [Gammaproteobacteria bacterium]|nr:response regulator [Gammaproteobacteria bacterium]